MAGWRVWKPPGRDQEQRKFMEAFAQTSKVLANFL